MSAEARFAAGSERPRGRGAPSAGLAAPPHLDLLVLGDCDAAAAWEAFCEGPVDQDLKAIRDACNSARLVAVEGVGT